MSNIRYCPYIFKFVSITIDLAMMLKCSSSLCYSATFSFIYASLKDLEPRAAPKCPSVVILMDKSQNMNFTLFRSFAFFKISQDLFSLTWQPYFFPSFTRVVETHVVRPVCQLPTHHLQATLVSHLQQLYIEPLLKCKSTLHKKAYCR